MTLLILSLVVAVIALVIFAFRLPFSNTNPKADQLSQEDNQSDKIISALKQQISDLEGELNDSKEELRKRILELNEAKGRELELNKEKEAGEKREGDLENTRKELAQIQNKLIEKDKSFNEQYSLNLKLRKELEDSKQEIDLLRKNSRQLTDLNRELESGAQQLKNKLQEQEKLILQMREKEHESDWISKKEYFNLEKELKDKQQEVERLQSELLKLKEQK